MSFSTARYTSARVLDNSDLMRAAPSIFAATPFRAMSARYKFIPTIDVVDTLRDRGFLPVRAEQGKSRIEGKADFTRHMIRFRHADHMGQVATLGAEIPEVVLMNSHDGTAAYKFACGIFRLVCMNGMVVQSRDYGSISVRHSGGHDFHDRVIDATYQIVEQAPAVLGQIEQWKGIQLTGPQQRVFAEAALELRDGPAAVQAPQLLAPRRTEDRPEADGTRDLWKTVNAVQENLVRGGIHTRSEATGKRMTTRPIKSVEGDVKTNKALWMLAEKMAELV